MKYFLSLEKKNYPNKLISTLEIDGNIVKDPTKIPEAQETFYKNLYSEKLTENNRSYKESLDKFLLDNDMPKLNMEQKEFCDKTISEAEILTSIKKLCSSKTPGSDGLPADFYKFFWCDIKNLLA